MKKLFDPCVDGVVDLILGQIQQVERSKNRVKVRHPPTLKPSSIDNILLQNVFLVGGFGESAYLQQELRKSLALRRIVMRRPEKTECVSTHHLDLM